MSQAAVQAPPSDAAPPAKCGALLRLEMVELAGEPTPPPDPGFEKVEGYYPPARTGLRGSHPGAMDAAHALAWAGDSNWCSNPLPTQIKEISVTTSSTQLKIGFVGLGIMGAPMAGHLIAGGHAVFTYTHGATPAALLDAGARVCASALSTASEMKSR